MLLQYEEAADAYIHPGVLPGAASPALPVPHKARAAGFHAEATPKCCCPSGACEQDGC